MTTIYIYIYVWKCSDTFLPSDGTSWKISRHGDEKKNNKTIDIEAMRERGTMASSDAGMLWGFLLRPMRNIFFFFL